MVKGERKSFSDEVKVEMIRLYTSGEVCSKEKIGSMFGTSKHKVNDVFLEFGIDAIRPGTINKIEAVIEGNKYIPTDEYTYVAVCKTTGKTFKDYDNVSGALITHIKEIFPQLEIPTKALRVTYYKKTGSYWYEQYFDIVKKEIVVTKKKGELYQEEIDEIVRLYSSNEINAIHKLGSMFKVGNKKISKILKSHNIAINTIGGQYKDIRKQKIEIKLPIKYKDEETTTYKAVCLLDNVEFADYNNDGGTLTRHLQNNYPDIIIPSYRGKKRYFINTGNYWYEEHFKIIQIVKAPVRKCDYCDFEMPINVSRRQYKMHLTMHHDMAIREHLNNFPNDKELFIEDYKVILVEDDEDNWATCGVCGVKMKVLSGKHLKTHGLTKFEYKVKYGDTLSPNYKDSIRDRMIFLNKTQPMYCRPSKSELEILEYVKSLGFEASSDRTVLNGKEIDILIEEKKFGIKFNGLKWHTDWFGGKDNNNHINKTLLANEKGYDLIQIFEDEWIDNKDIVLNKIKHSLGKNNDDETITKIGARKTIIKEVSRSVAHNFLNDYHIQGGVDASVYLGCYYNSTLLAVMTFKKLTNISLDYDLTRFATNYNFLCQGVASKLLKYFVKNYNPTSIISFADRRWTLNNNDNLYTKLGFKLVKELKPDYRYYNENEDRYTRHHKFKFRKAILNKKYGLPMEMTETEMVKELGYDRIWDCGLLKYRLDLCGGVI